MILVFSSSGCAATYKAAPNTFNFLSFNSTLSTQIQPYLLSLKTENSPTFFQIVFITNGITYRYGFEATKQEITSEWLFSNNNKANNKEIYLFKREFQEITINIKQYKDLVKFKKFVKTENPIARNNSLLIPALSALNEPISTTVQNYISTNFFTASGLGDKHIRGFIDEMIQKDDNLRNEILTTLKYSDTGIEDIASFEPSELNVDSPMAESFLQHNKRPTCLPW